MSERTRMTVDLSARHTDFLARYCAKHGVSKAEALRRAIDLQRLVQQARDDGLTPGAFGPDLQREFVQ